MTELDRYELVFGLLTLLFAGREFLRVWKEERKKPKVRDRKTLQPLLLRSRKLLALACLMVIASGPVGYHSILIVKQLNGYQAETPKPLPAMEIPWLSERVIRA